MPGPNENELYELLLELDRLEEMLEDLQEQGFTPLTRLSELPPGAMSEEQRELLKRLSAQGIRTVQDIERLLEAREVEIEE